MSRCGLFHRYHKIKEQLVLNEELKLRYGYDIQKICLRCNRIIDYIPGWELQP